MQRIIKLRPGPNVWIRMDGDSIVERAISPDRPPGENWWPHYAKSRVRGSSYTPYDGPETDWTRAANACLKLDARYNHETSETH